MFVVTGDGDGLSIGGNHLLHVLRRNVDVTILLFNNRIYGLTKGQYSPTSELGKVTKSTPLGSADRPLSPCAFALAAGATFVARTVDRNIAHMEETLKRASAHKGAAFVEILQNCNVYNDMAWKRALRPGVEGHCPSCASSTASRCCSGPPTTAAALVLEGVRPKVVRAAGRPAERVWVHDETDAATALVLAQLWAPEYPIPLGVLASKRGDDLRGDPDPPGAAGHLGARAGRHRQAAALGRDLEDQAEARRRARPPRPAPAAGSPAARSGAGRVPHLLAARVAPWT